jgi:hypothetical protein
MDGGRACIPAHPQGEVERDNPDRDLVDRGKAVETFGGKVFVRWDPDAQVTAFAPVAYFIEFPKANGLWRQWVKECPLDCRSGNAPPKQDILGTILPSVLAGPPACRPPWTRYTEVRNVQAAHHPGTPDSLAGAVRSP